MKLLIDADGCPVVDIALTIAKDKGIPCVIFCDTAHILEKPGAETVTVTKGADSADFALLNRVGKRDIIVTQDYGLAAMCLAKGGRAINQNGMVFDDSNMDALLNARHTAKQIRRAGGRLKGPAKRTRDQDKKFALRLLELMKEDR